MKQIKMTYNGKFGQTLFVNIACDTTYISVLTKVNYTMVGKQQTTIA